MAANVTKAQRDLRRQLVLEYTIAGASTRETAAELTRQGIPTSHATVAADRLFVLADMREKNAKESEFLRTVTNDRYERIIASRWADAIDGNDQALDRVIRTIEAQRKLNGLDSAEPPPASITIHNTVAAATAPRVRRLVMEYPDDYDPAKYGIQR